ncbi:MAG TPA: transglycosylase SLT domain-containing protein [Rhodocyclaceae bacterium]|nr:transglycosylase SLT domain-containing protein [Rhodocyclaceae bacterium]
MLPITFSPLPLAASLAEYATARRFALRTSLAVAGGSLLMTLGIPTHMGFVSSQVAMAAEAEVQRREVSTETELAVDTARNPASSPSVEILTPRMRAALGYASRRYRVSQDALEPVFMVVQKAAKEFTLDPLLIVAVIAVESRFNPISQSDAGAQGLMQVIPRYHMDKLPVGAGKLPFFDPAINVRVGAMALRDFIRRGGGITAGLQLFAGEMSDPGQSYSTRVLAEKERLEYASRRARPGTV